MTGRRARGFAVVVGALRMASGISFLIAPEAANRLWGDEEDSGPSGRWLFLGWFGALTGATSLLLIVYEGTWVPFITTCG